MASDVNDITMQYEEDGVVLVKELDKVRLAVGAMILFPETMYIRRLPVKDPVPSI